MGLSAFILKDILLSLSTVREPVSHHLQGCGDVIFLIQMDKYKASLSSLAVAHHQVSIKVCVYLGELSISGQLSKSITINFTLHTEPRVSPPEFTISCQTHGGPATEVIWKWNREHLTKNVTDSGHVILMEGSQNHSVYIETSQTILDTSFDSVYDSKLFVRGRVGGEFSCSIRNIRNPFSYSPHREDNH